MMSTASRRLHCWLALSLLLSTLTACDKSEEAINVVDSSNPADFQKESTTDAPSAPFDYKPSEGDCLLTWVDDGGSFQLAEKRSEVPPQSRSIVRVVSAAHPTGNAEWVWSPI